MKKFVLEATVFMCGAMVMILELTAARIMAPYFGTSNMIWTSIIGIILLSSSLGAYLGGRISDKNPECKLVSIIILIASLWILLLPLINPIVLETTRSLFKDIRIGAVLSAMILFLIPSLLLGTISPFAVKLKMKDLNVAGKIAGKLSAIATLGSIIGTFLAGFVLIPFLGLTQILYLIGITLTILAFVLYTPSIKKTISIFTLVIFMTVTGYTYTESLAKDKILDIDSEYGRIIVYDTEISDRLVRILNIDSGIESAMFLDNQYDLVIEYTKYYNLMNYFNNDINNALLIGGAAYSYPKYFLDKYPERKMDVVEIDPVVTAVAKDYFDLKENDRLTIYHQDGRVYLNETEKEYDVILNDAFKGVTVPFQLATKEAAEKVYNALSPNGIYLTNVHGSLQGDKSKFLIAEVNTLKQIFPNVYIFACNSVNDVEMIQNIMVVATKDSKRKDIELIGDRTLDEMLRNYNKRDSNDNSIIFTDNHSPADYYSEMIYNI